MATTVWKGHLTFGLISVPLRVYAAARTETIGFHLIHEACGTRIRQHLWCPTDEEEVQRKDLVKGHEVGDGQYVVIDDSELEKIIPPSGKTMEVLEFVKMDEVDPVYLDTSYYLVPEEAGEKAYYLLCQALEDSGTVGIAHLTMHQREQTVVVRPSMGGLMLHTVFYPNEVRKVEGYGKPSRSKVSEKELAMARLFIDSLAAKYEPEKYHDQYKENLKKLIAAKAEGRTMTLHDEQPAATPVVDLMAALKASIEQRGIRSEARPRTSSSKAARRK